MGLWPYAVPMHGPLAEANAVHVWAHGSELMLGMNGPMAQICGSAPMGPVSQSGDVYKWAHGPKLLQCKQIWCFVCACWPSECSACMGLWPYAVPMYGHSACMVPWPKRI